MHKKIAMTLDQLMLIFYLWKGGMKPFQIAQQPSIRNDVKTIEKYIRMFKKAMNGEMIDEPVKVSIFNELCKKMGWPEPRYEDHLGKINQGCNHPRHDQLMPIRQIIDMNGKSIIITNDLEWVKNLLIGASEHPNNVQCLTTTFMIDTERLHIVKKVTKTN